MTKKQRRLREKRKAEIRSKQLKRIEQRMNVKYGKGKLYYPIPSMLVLGTMTAIRFYATKARIAELTNMYSKLQERSKALLEGS